MVRRDDNQRVVVFRDVLCQLDGLAELFRFLESHAGPVLVVRHVDACAFHEQEVAVLLLLQELDGRLGHLAQRRLLVLQPLALDVLVVLAVIVAEQPEQIFSVVPNVVQSALLVNVLALAVVRMEPLLDQIATVAAQSPQVFLVEDGAVAELGSPAAENHPQSPGHVVFDELTRDVDGLVGVASRVADLLVVFPVPVGNICARRRKRSIPEFR